MSVNVTTTAGETFTAEQSEELAYMVYRRFGRNLSAATSAWRRLLQNNASEGQFEKLVRARQTSHTHTR
jgi:hypothetical protein